MKYKTIVASAALCTLLFVGCGDKDTTPEKNETSGQKADKDPGTSEADFKPISDEEARDRAKAIAKKAYEWYLTRYNSYVDNKDPRQQPMGWGNQSIKIGDSTMTVTNGGLTAFVVLNALKSGAVEISDVRMQNAIAGMIDNQQPSGAWDFGGGMRAVYLTSAAVECLGYILSDHKDELKGDMESRIRQAAGDGMLYLRRAQIGTPSLPLNNPTDSEDPMKNQWYGGWAYSAEELALDKNKSKPKANNSTSSFALDAAAAFGLSKDDPLMTAAQLYFSRGQNAEEAVPADRKIRIENVHDQLIVMPATNDPSYGGGRYSPDTSKVRDEGVGEPGVAEITVSSYGSMTYALLRAYLLTGLNKNDQRVQLAYKWLARNFTVEDVPGFSADNNFNYQGYFYQFHQMAKTLTLFDERVIEKPNGIKVDWRNEMLTKLEELQNDDGSFNNDKNERWMEAEPFIASVYVISACAQIVEGMGK